MASGTLYTYPNNFRAYKVLIAAKYAAGNVSVAEDFKFGETNKEPAFLAKFPLGKVPAFESSSGVCLYESNAIAYYVSNDQLTGTNRLDSSNIQQWIAFSENEIVPSASAWVFPCLGVTQFNKQETDKAKVHLKTVLDVLDQHLLTRTYLVGESITLADIIVMCNVLLFCVLNRETDKAKVHLKTVIDVLDQHLLTRTYLVGESITLADIIVMCNLLLPYEHKKEKKPEKEEEEPEVTIAELEAKQAKDPFASLPSGTFNMDEFKRTYCNKDIETVAIPYLWDNFDSENYSIWHSEYQYADSLDMIFMTCNLVSGMMQRLDKLNKNAFASILIFGDDSKNSIAGVWMWKGQELVFPLSENWKVDYESYKWDKLDPSDPKARELVNQYLILGDTEEGTIDGRIVNQSKIFK